jgi:hypothetical protein
MSDPQLAPTKNTATPPPAAQLVTLAVPLFVLQARYRDFDGKEKALPSHRWSAVGSIPGGILSQHAGVQSDADAVSSIGADKDFAEAKRSWHLYWSPVFTDPADLVDWSKREEAWIDMDKNEWVATSKLAPLEKRRLVRVPLWTTPLKAKNGKFNDSPNDDFTKTGILKGDEILKKLKANDTFGTKAKPWLFLIDHEWMRAFVRYFFYNFKTKKMDTVPPGLVVRATKAGQKTVGGGTAIDAKGTVFVLHQQTKDDAKKNVDYTFTTPASFSFIDLDVAAPAAPPPAKDDRVVTVDKVPPGGAVKRYLLPPVWHSKGMEAFLDSGGAPSRKPFNDLRGEDATKAKPLAFHLDDFVLFDMKRNAPSVLAADSRLTLFDHRMKLKGPFDPVFVNMLADKVKGKYFRAEERFVKAGDDIRAATFVVNHEADFFVIRERRIGGAVEKTDTVGARMAAARAPEDPIGNFIAGYPNLNNDGTVELLLLPDAYEGPYVAADEGKYLDAHAKVKFGHMLVYVPLKVQAAVVGTGFVDAPTAADVVPLGQMNTVYQALLDAAARWDQAHPAGGATSKKDYVLVPEAGVKDDTRVIKMRHFFGPRTDGNHKFTILATFKNGFGAGDRSFVAGNQMSLVVSPPGAPVYTDPGDTAQDSDNVNLPWFTLAHELGHTMGLPDEYGEIPNIPVVAPAPSVPTFDEPRILRFGQRDPGYPFLADLTGMMRSNKLPRLRYIWHHVTAFLNGGAKTQLPEGPYVAVYDDFRHGLTHKIPDGNTANPWKVDTQAHGPGNRSNLVLYRCGDDEATVERMFPRPASGPNRNAVNPGAWMQGILVVTTKIWFNFLKSAAGDFPDHAARYAVMQDFHKLFFDNQMLLQQKFFIEGDASLKLPRIGILLQPRMEFGPVPQPRVNLSPPNVNEGDADVVTDVVFDAPPSAPVVPAHWPPTTKPRLRLYQGQAKLSLFRFAMNVTPAAGVAPNNAPLTTADLTPLAAIVQKMLGDKATDPPRVVKDLPT